MKSVMTPFPYDIGPHEPIGKARKMMLDKHIHHLPVTDNHVLKGIVSDRDIKLMLGPEFDYPDPRDVTVADVMVEDPYVVDIETTLTTVLDELVSRHIGTALVTKDGRLAGIFSTGDACRELSARLKAEFGDPSDGPDAA